MVYVPFIHIIFMIFVEIRVRLNLDKKWVYINLTKILKFVMVSFKVDLSHKKKKTKKLVEKRNRLESLQGIWLNSEGIVWRDLR